MGTRMNAVLQPRAAVFSVRIPTLWRRSSGPMRNQRVPDYRPESFGMRSQVRRIDGGDYDAGSATCDVNLPRDPPCRQPKRRSARALQRGHEGRADLPLRIGAPTEKIPQAQTQAAGRGGRSTTHRCRSSFYGGRPVAQYRRWRRGGLPHRGESTWPTRKGRQSMLRITGRVR